MIESLLVDIVNDNSLHAKWLNTLSYMENCGARKISKYEHSNQVDITVLKHAAEEHRHAFYLKNMIARVEKDSCEFYGQDEVLGGYDSFQYLPKLDIYAARYLKQELGIQGSAMKQLAYLLVTYAIEMRADELYPIYQSVLKRADSKVSVYNIIKEEEGHLREMILSLEGGLPNWEEHAKVILQYEKELFNHWLTIIEAQIRQPA